MTTWVSLLDWTPAYIEQYGGYPRVINVSRFHCSWSEILVFSSPTGYMVVILGLIFDEFGGVFL